MRNGVYPSNMEMLEKIARLIIENPSITVQEIAKQLGYSEERSIYYWLEKGNFRGIKPFKKAVLTKQFFINGPGPAYGEENRIKELGEGERYALKRVPIVGQFSLNGHPDISESSQFLITDRVLGPDAFAFVLETNDYLPLANFREMLIVDPQAALENGDLALVWTKTAGILLRRYYADERPLLVHPTRAAEIRRLPARQGETRLLGRVMFSVREW